MQTVKSEQLKFTAPFRLQVARNDYLAAFCLYFDTGFTQCKPPIWFSTSPRAQYTHWRQSVFYLPDALVVSKDELVTGSLSIKPNAKNHRDMDFVLTYTHKGKVEGFTCGPSKVSLLVGKLEDTLSEYCDVDDIDCTDITHLYD